MRDLTGASAEIVVVGGNRKRSTACSSNSSSTNTTTTATNSANNSSSSSGSSSSSSDSPEPKCPKRQRRSRRGSAATAAAAAAAATTTTTTTTATTAAAAGQAPEEQRPEARMEQGGDPITDDSTTTPGFVDCLRRIVLSNDPQVVSDAWNSLEEMENLESGSQDATYDCNRHYDRFLRDLLTNNHIRNVNEMPRLLEWFSKFPFPNTAHISDDIAKFLVASAKDFKDHPCLADILEVLSDNHTKYLTPHHNHSNLWKAIVEVLSWYKVPEDPGEVKKYSRDLTIISDFLKKKNSDTSGDKSNVFMCFMKLCEILIESNRKKPSSALITILQLIDEKLWNEYMKVAVEQLFCQYEMYSNTDERVVKMLVLFCHWLTQPPFTHIKYLSTWLTLFMKGLMAVQKRRLVMDVADTVLPEIFSKCIRLQQFSQIENENNIIFYLMPHLSSLEIIHKMMKLIDSYLNDREVMMPKDANIRKHVIEITKELLRKFQQHFGNQPCPICDKVNSLIEYAEKNEGSRYVEVSFPSTSSGIGKIDSGKVGLRNLGNTCYMNSVLQALVMTRQFCHEVLLYKSTNDLSDQTVLKNLQNLFALLKYSEKIHLAPTEILRTSRPAYFMPGQQQDSSEFLCHLLDVMYEQEKSALLKNSNSEQNINTKLKIEDKEMTDIEEVVGASDSPINDDGTPKTIARWTTEENLSEGVSLQRKTQSLADFTQGEELAQTQNGLSDSHSDSTDSGIQSVGGEDSSSSSSATSSSSFLVQRVFGGELKVTYQCMQCGTESHNTDQFRDLQLCFLDVDTMPPTHAIKVQDLINSNYSMPESLTGDNKYRCERCANLCDAQRIIKILQAPAHLILTLKHFRYDSESRLRTKLRRKVIYDETIQLPVLDQDNETYQLYAAVVHSGYSMDYGHYITYACDAKNRWYKFNDSYVAQTTLEDFKSLEPPDTPYILFYRRCGRHKEPDEDAPDFASLTKSLQDYVEQEKRGQSEERRVTRHSVAGSSIARYPKVYDRDDEDDEDHQPPSKCGDAVTIPNQKFLF